MQLHNKCKSFIMLQPLGCVSKLWLVVDSVGWEGVGRCWLGEGVKRGYYSTAYVQLTGLRSDMRLYLIVLDCTGVHTTVLSCTPVVMEQDFFFLQQPSL